MSASTIENSIRPLMERLTCDTCKASMNERIREVVVQWSLVKVSLCFTVMNLASKKYGFILTCSVAISSARSKFVTRLVE